MNPIFKILTGVMLTVVLFGFSLFSWIPVKSGENEQRQEIESQNTNNKQESNTTQQSSPTPSIHRPEQPLQTQRSQNVKRPVTTAQKSLKQPQAPKTVHNEISALTADEQQMLRLVNEARIQNGLKPLSANKNMTTAARAKAKDMIDNNYFSHNSPTYGSPFEMLKKFGVYYRTAGENLAGAGTVDTAHKNLMNSPGHRANILNGNYREIGIGVISGGPYGKMFVQLFTG
ncbi:MAG: CAP domain-containing protein [Bacillota bacterium]